MRLTAEYNGVFNYCTESTRIIFPHTLDVVFCHNIVIYPALLLVNGGNVADDGSQCNEFKMIRA